MARGPLNMEEKIAALRKFWTEERRAPSFWEMMKLFHYKSKNSVAQAVDKLEEAGYLKRSGTGRVSVMPKLTAPLRLLGSIVAGFPVDEEEMRDAPAISLDEYLLPAAPPDRLYMLTVRGDSMKDAGIIAGDIVIVERECEPRPHDIVVACVDGEWTLKYFVPDQAGVRLEPANPKYSFIRARQSLIIGGVVRSVIRKY